MQHWRINNTLGKVSTWPPQLLPAGGAQLPWPAMKPTYSTPSASYMFGQEVETESSNVWTLYKLDSL